MRTSQNPIFATHRGSACQPPRRRSALVGWLAAVSLVIGLAGCAGQAPMQLPQPVNAPQSREAPESVQVQQGGTAQTKVRGTPALPSQGGSAADGDNRSRKNADGTYTVNIDQMPLPKFVQLVFGQMLGLNIQVDPAVRNHREMITLRADEPMSRAELLDAARAILGSYGVAVVQQGAIYRVLPDKSVGNITPEFLRARALPETPANLRPVFQYVQLQAAKANEIRNLLHAVMQQRVQIMVDAGNNALILFGQRPAVREALNGVRVLDRPSMKGRHGRRVELAFQDPDTLATQLARVLEGEGYSVASGQGSSGAIELIPVPASGSLVVFAPSAATLDHVVKWVRDLDSPARATSGQGLYIYNVRHANAKDLADTVNSFFGAGAGAAAPATSTQQDQGATRAPPAGGAIQVNPATNSIIFRGAATDFEQLRKLLRELDRPTPQVLIEVTVAEVSLDNSKQTGIEWALAQAQLGDYALQGGTIGGLGLAQGGLNLTLLNNRGQTRALLNALASNNRARILSTPRVIARNGQEASINVGDQVPIITSQQSTDATSDGDSAILQTVQYRDTGVLLTVTPTVHGRKQVDLDIKQEVSSARSTTTGVASSPTISKRSIDTSLSVPDSQTVVLGGLMSREQNQTDTGIPFLKDLPGIGALFRNRTRSHTRTNLLVLLTPHVLRQPGQLDAVTQALKERFSSADTADEQDQRPLRNNDNPDAASAPGNGDVDTTGTAN